MGEHMSKEAYPDHCRLALAGLAADSVELIRRVEAGPPPMADGAGHG